jgi:hypothetical protein
MIVLNTKFINVTQSGISMDNVGPGAIKLYKTLLEQCPEYQLEIP